MKSLLISSLLALSLQGTVSIYSGDLMHCISNSKVMELTSVYDHFLINGELVIKDNNTSIQVIDGNTIEFNKEVFICTSTTQGVSDE